MSHNLKVTLILASLFGSTLISIVAVVHACVSIEEMFGAPAAFLIMLDSTIFIALGLVGSVFAIPYQYLQFKSKT